MRWIIDETPNLYSLFKTVIGSTFGLCDEECALVASYLTLMTEDAPQRDFPLHEVFNGLRWIVEPERNGA